MAIVRRLVVRPERARPGGEPTNGKLAVRASLIHGSRQTGPQFLGVGQMPQHRPDAPSGGPQIEGESGNAHGLRRQRLGGTAQAVERDRGRCRKQRRQ